VVVTKHPAESLQAFAASVDLLCEMLTTGVTGSPVKQSTIHSAVSHTCIRPPAWQRHRRVQ
jgi:hypothetical protein